MMLNSPLLPSLRISALFALVLSGAGCTIIVDGDDHDHDHDAQESAWERCLDDHEDCLDDADGAMGAVFACNEALDRCTGADAEDPTTGGTEQSTNTSADQDDEQQCPPEDDADVEGCLAEHVLCTACAEGEAELAACQSIFDSCVNPPM